MLKKQRCKLLPWNAHQLRNFQSNGGLHLIAPQHDTKVTDKITCLMDALMYS